MNPPPLRVPIYGTKSSEVVPKESTEMTSFFNRLRREYPKTWGALALHIRNEDRTATARQVVKIKSEGGFVKGAPDIFIPGVPSFVCEMKSRSKTARVSKEQIEYLEAAQSLGAFSCIALGAEGAWEAFEDYLRLYYGEK